MAGLSGEGVVTLSEGMSAGLVWGRSFNGAQRCSGFSRATFGPQCSTTGDCTAD